MREEHPYIIYGHVAQGKENRKKITETGYLKLHNGLWEFFDKDIEKQDIIESLIIDDDNSLFYKNGNEVPWAHNEAQWALFWFGNETRLCIGISYLYGRFRPFPSIYLLIYDPIKTKENLPSLMQTYFPLMKDYLSRKLMNEGIIPINYIGDLTTITMLSNLIHFNIINRLFSIVGLPKEEARYFDFLFQSCLKLLSKIKTKTILMRSLTTYIEKKNQKFSIAFSPYELDIHQVIWDIENISLSSEDFVNIETQLNKDEPTLSIDITLTTHLLNKIITNFQKIPRRRR